MLISANLQVRIAMTTKELETCSVAFYNEKETKIPSLSGVWLIFSIEKSFSGCSIKPWIVDLHMRAISSE